MVIFSSPADNHQGIFHVKRARLACSLSNVSIQFLECKIAGVVSKKTRVLYKNRKLCSVTIDSPAWQHGSAISSVGCQQQNSAVKAYGRMKGIEGQTQSQQRGFNVSFRFSFPGSAIEMRRESQFSLYDSAYQQQPIQPSGHIPMLGALESHWTYHPSRSVRLEGRWTPELPLPLVSYEEVFYILQASDYTSIKQHCGCPSCQASWPGLPRKGLEEAATTALASIGTCSGIRVE